MSFMTRTQFIQELRAGRAEWDAALAQLDDARLAMPVGESDWTVKDLLAHVAWFEREMIDLVRDRALVGSDLWQLPADERNAAIYEQERGRAPDEVLQSARQVYAQLWERVQGLTDEELNDPGRFRNMPPDWLPWQILADNTYDHYRAHLAELRAVTR